MQKIAVIGLLLLDDDFEEDTDDLTNTLVETVRDEWDLEDDQVHIRIFSAPQDMNPEKMQQIVTGVSD